MKVEDNGLLQAYYAIAMDIRKLLNILCRFFNVLGEHFHSGKFSQLCICSVSHNLLLLLLLIETLLAFFHILDFANISTVNQQALQRKSLINTFGLHLRIIITVRN